LKKQHQPSDNNTQLSSRQISQWSGVSSIELWPMVAVSSFYLSTFLSHPPWVTLHPLR
jgi:hypothetical protein